MRGGAGRLDSDFERSDEENAERHAPVDARAQEKRVRLRKDATRQRHNDRHELVPRKGDNVDIAQISLNLNFDLESVFLHVNFHYNCMHVVECSPLLKPFLGD